MMFARLRLRVCALLFLLPFFAGALLAQLHHVVYAPSDSLFPNPERGFYSHMEVQAEGSPLSLNTLRGVRNTKGQSLILRLYYLKAFRASDLSQAQLTLMETDFSRMREAGVKCILRFAYSQSETEADAPLATVLRHLDQMKPLLETNRDVIAVVQAGFIGAWGEWYYSTNGLNNTNDRRSVVTKILEVLPADRMTQVRTPNYKQAIFTITDPLTELQAYTGIPVARTGHHNDCFLASYDDYGTYQDTSADKAYLSEDTRFTPMGGETCASSQFSGCTNALKELARMHWTYLNADYNSYVLAGWTSGGCMNEVKRRLGYRFQFIDGQYTDSVSQGLGLRVQIRLVNRGWAAPFNLRPVRLVLVKDDDTTAFGAALPVDPRFWGAGDTVDLDFSIGVPQYVSSGQYQLMLSMPDPAEALAPRPEYAIRLANDSVWEWGSGRNSLRHVVTVDPAGGGEAYPDSLIFKPLESLTSVGWNATIPGDAIRLHGNYPNPFNGSTRIVFSVGRRSPVEFQVFDVLGRLVQARTLSDMSPGRHEIPFDAAQLAGGVYFYRLAVHNGHATGRILYLK
ncbi:MAG: DUF4832 domain-containing protein [Bacteroidetes bacterium]|nr:DUF4832 domain-containing protein [Bacteroidota bacterium]